MADTLKPCPFCGSDEVSLSYAMSAELHDVISSRFVECERCAAMGPAAGEEAGAVEFWNRRTPTQGEA